MLISGNQEQVIFQDKRRNPQVVVWNGSPGSLQLNEKTRLVFRRFLAGERHPTVGFASSLLNRTSFRRCSVPAWRFLARAIEQYKIALQNAEWWGLPLFHSQRRDWIDIQGTPRRNIGSGQRNNDKQQGSAEEGRRVGGRHLE